jgi:hypothetical protein
MTPWGPLVSDRGREEGERPWLSGLATQAGHPRQVGPAYAAGVRA